MKKVNQNILSALTTHDLITGSVYTFNGYGDSDREAREFHKKLKKVVSVRFYMCLLKEMTEFEAKEMR